MAMQQHYAEIKDLFPMQGGCVCGAIRYELLRAPLLVHHCHCTACQRQTGTAFSNNAILEADSLRLLPPLPAPTNPGSRADAEGLDAPGVSALAAFARTTGAAAIAGVSSADVAPPRPLLLCVPSESGCGQVVAQCPACHTALWNHYADAGPRLAYVRVGTLDQAWHVEPDVEIFTRSRRAFVKELGGGKPQFEGYYPDRMALLRDDAKQRLEAIKESIDEWKADFKAAM